MHKKILKNIIIYSCFIILFLFVNTVAAQTLEISPSAFNIEGEYGEFQLKEVQFTNTGPFDITVNISKNDLNGLYLSSTLITIPANSVKLFPLGFMVQWNQIGWINYRASFMNATANYNQLVFMNVNDTEAEIYLFPSEPQSGDTLVFLDMSDTVMDTQGIVYISSSKSSYLVTIHNGMGQIQLGDDDYGNAFLQINSNGRKTFKEFYIQKGEGGPSNNQSGSSGDGASSSSEKPSILSPQSVDYGEIKDISVMIGNNTGIGTKVLITRPNGFSYEGATNSFGRLSVEFNEVGRWEFTVVHESKTANSATSVQKKNELIVLKTDDPEAEGEITIQVFDDANVKVTGPHGFTASGYESNNLYSFNPDEPGEYYVEADSAKSHGELSVTVCCKPRIVISDSTGNIVHGSINTEESYYIKLLDFNNNPLELNQDLEIYNTASPYTEPVKIPMVEEVAYWSPNAAGNYRISFVGDGVYSSTDMLIPVENALEESGIIDFWMLPVVMVIILIILSYAYASGRLKLLKAKMRQRRESKKIGKKEKHSDYDDIHQKVDNMIPV